MVIAAPVTIGKGKEEKKKESSPRASDLRYPRIGLKNGRR
jgi:hypothetical protein